MFELIQRCFVTAVETYTRYFSTAVERGGFVFHAIVEGFELGTSQQRQEHFYAFVNAVNIQCVYKLVGGFLKLQIIARKRGRFSLRWMFAEVRNKVSICDWLLAEYELGRARQLDVHYKAIRVLITARLQPCGPKAKRLQSVPLASGT